MTSEHTTTDAKMVSGPTPGAQRRRVSPVAIAERYALVVLLLVLFALFAALPQTGDAFLTSANLKTLISNQSVVALVALASIVPLIAGEIDLSAASIAGFSGLIAAGLASTNGWNVPAIMIAGVAVGAATGVVNGFLVAYIGVGSIVATLGTSTVILAIVTWYSAGQTIVSGIPQGLLELGAGDWFGIPRAIYYVVVISALLWYLLQQTPQGRHLYFIGANAKAAELVGLAVRRYTMSSFIIAGIIAGAAGLLQVAISGSASPQVGPGFTLPALAAAFLGATVINPGRFNVIGTIVAVLFVAIIVNGLTLLGAADWIQPLVNGLSLLAAVVIATVAGRRTQR